MTDLEMVRALLAKVSTCTIVVNQDVYIQAAGTYGSEDLVFEFDTDGNIIALGS